MFTQNFLQKMYSKITIAVTIMLLMISTVHAQGDDMNKAKNKKDKFIVQASALHNIFLANHDNWHKASGIVSKPYTNVSIGNNPTNYQLGLLYERIFTKNLNASAGIIYGTSKQSLEWDLTSVIARPHGSAIYTSFSTSDYTASYIAIPVKAGVDIAPFRNNRIAFQLKAGVSYLRYLKTSDSKQSRTSYFHIDDTSSGRVYTTRETYTNKNAYYLTGYFGVAYRTHAKFLKEYRIGVSFTKGFHGFPRSHGYVSTTQGTYYTLQNQYISTDRHYNRFRNMVITLGIVL